MRQIRYIFLLAEIYHIALPQFVSHSDNEMNPLLNFEIWENERGKQSLVMIALIILDYELLASLKRELEWLSTLT